MPFLLLLSALLTALTGVVTGTRPADVQIARHIGSTAVAEVAAAARPSIAAHTNLAGGYGTITAFTLVGPDAPRITAAPRLYLARLRL